MCPATPPPFPPPHRSVCIIYVCLPTAFLLFSPSRALGQSTRCTNASACQPKAHHNRGVAVASSPDSRPNVQSHRSLPAQVLSRRRERDDPSVPLLHSHLSQITPVDSWGHHMHAHAASSSTRRQVRTRPVASHKRGRLVSRCPSFLQEWCRIRAGSTQRRVQYVREMPADSSSEATETGTAGQKGGVVRICIDSAYMSQIDNRASKMSMRG